MRSDGGCECRQLTDAGGDDVLDQAEHIARPLRGVTSPGAAAPHRRRRGHVPRRGVRRSVPSGSAGCAPRGRGRAAGMPMSVRATTRARRSTIGHCGTTPSERSATHRASSSSNQLSEYSPFRRDGVEQPQQHAGAGLPWPVQPLGRGPHVRHVGVTRRASVDARCTRRRSRTTEPTSASVRVSVVHGMPSTVVTSNGSSGVTWWATMPASCNRCRRSTLASMTAIPSWAKPSSRCSRAAARCDAHGLPTSGEHGHHQPLVPRRRSAGEHEDARHGLLEPALPFGGEHSAVIEVDGGSLGPGERPMLRGCELGNGAHCVVRHGPDRTEGVSQARRCEPRRRMIRRQGSRLRHRRNLVSGRRPPGSGRAR